VQLTVDLSTFPQPTQARILSFFADLLAPPVSVTSTGLPLSPPPAPPVAPPPQPGPEVFKPAAAVVPDAPPQPGPEVFKPGTPEHALQTAVEGGAAAPVPPLPPAPPAPAAAPVASPPSAAAAPTAAPAPQLDSRGLPWDQRIHSSGKAMNEDGTWRKKRGLMEARVHEVERELRALMALPAPAAAPAVPPAPAPAPVVVPLPPAPAPAPAAPEVPLPPAGSTEPTTFAELMSLLTPVLSSGRLTNADMFDTLKLCGLDSLPLLTHRPDMVPGFWSMVKTKIKPAA
jgi:hypothetical protein